MLRINNLEHVLIGKVIQLFRNISSAGEPPIASAPFYRGFAPISMGRGAAGKLCVNISNEIAPKHKRCRGQCASLRIIAFPRPDLVKIKTLVKRQSGMITGLDFEKQRLDPLRRQRGNMRGEECPADAPAPATGRHRDCQDLGLVENQARQDKAVQHWRFAP